MNGTVREWIDKAEGDYRTARREFEAVDSPSYDATCFHAQQFVEKLMKAIMIHNKVVPPRIHNLAQFSGLLEPLCPELDLAIEDLNHLTTLGMAVRYPGESADCNDAEEVLQICDRLRDALEPFIPRG
ncbi:MAG: HEPN domain-containing protein [Phycisphaerales bacterium]|nr:MAG: HEPN domain-containing protein [Phycisphaerales bacterium]